MIFRLALTPAKTCFRCSFFACASCEGKETGNRLYALIAKQSIAQLCKKREKVMQEVSKPLSPAVKIGFLVFGGLLLLATLVVGFATLGTITSGVFFVAGLACALLFAYV